MNADFFIYLITLIAIAGVIIRPYKIQESVWAVGGAMILLLFGLISLHNAWTGISKGLDVYLFLIGMMALAESARKEGLFDWLASYAIKLAAGSAVRLFILIYLIGTFVTVLMSNDATAVVLTPAVAAAVVKAKVKNPLPYLLICAFIANAASFVLPISNPANLVIYGSDLPSLTVWISTYFLPSIVAVGITFSALFITQKKFLKENLITDNESHTLDIGGKMALAGIIFTTLILLLASFQHWDLGLPTAITGLSTAIIISIAGRKNPAEFLRDISWSVIPLVAGLFILVEAVQQTGIINILSQKLSEGAHLATENTIWSAGFITAFGSNLINNLPAGLIAGTTLSDLHLPEMIRNSILIGIDLGPNLSITGSLATILWLRELRKNGYEISAWDFLTLGIVVMIPALIGALFVLTINI
ncbi:arsenical pump membrane protein [Chryseobacterium taeanense]|uniref:Arsenical pump membrane protein n=1 Tax=Chryseobacterium taeanense TaxID=311334 RepID=A0A1G8L8Y1_9FLAO|nr:arsenic transporter [Chryseobacterium taeanense]SDI51957.1 arsenical pump membrane protein [Chryseobacterium taeanense]